MRAMTMGTWALYNRLFFVGYPSPNLTDFGGKNVIKTNSGSTTITTTTTSIINNNDKKKKNIGGTRQIICGAYPTQFYAIVMILVISHL